MVKEMWTLKSFWKKIILVRNSFNLQFSVVKLESYTVCEIDCWNYIFPFLTNIKIDNLIIFVHFSFLKHKIHLNNSFVGRLIKNPNFLLFKSLMDMFSIFKPKFSNMTRKISFQDILSIFFVKTNAKKTLPLCID